VVEALNQAEIAVGPVNTYPEAVKDPHVLERDTIQRTQIEDGSIATLNAPVVKFSRTPTRVRTGAPAIGSHNDEILAEIGIEPATRKRLRAAGII
jgi:formyl-CoA transferase